MGKGSAVLGVIALILGASGLGLGGFAWISVSQIETQVNSWHKYVDPAFICNPASTYLTFTDLTIEFLLEPAESVHFSFTSVAHVEAIPSGYFERTSIKALGNFKYKPRIINGNPVRVEGVRHLISFALEEK